MGTARWYSKRTDGNKNVSPHFKVYEFSCKDGTDAILIDTDFVSNQLEAIRNHFNKAVHINSGYRTYSHNKAVGGATGSYHLQGRAFDIEVSGTKPLDVAQYAESLANKNGYGGVLLYNTFVHVDSRDKVVLLDERNGEKRVTTFGTENFSVRVRKQNLVLRLTPYLDGARNYTFNLNGYIPVGTYTIVDTVKHDGYTWGKLLSGAGWIALEYTERLG